jgi:hypothetical protein
MTDMAQNEICLTDTGVNSKYHRGNGVFGDECMDRIIDMISLCFHVKQRLCIKFTQNPC